MTVMSSTGTLPATTGTGGVQVGPPHVVVNQHFKAPPADRHREARLARLSQFLG